MPSVSVVLPVYNGERFVAAAVGSILDQSWRDLEVIVVDDASTDGTAAILSRIPDPRLRVVTAAANEGLPRALNRGLDAARGALIARQDADDVSHPERIARQVAFLETHPDVALLGTQGRVIDESGAVVGRVDRPRTWPAIRWFSLLDTAFIHTSVMFRRAVAHAAGGYDTSLPLAEDFDLWGRMLRTSRAANLDERLVDYRSWSASIMGAIEQGGAASRADRRRQTLADIVRDRIVRHTADAFGDEGCTAADARLLAAYAVGVPARDLGAFLTAFRDLRRRFEQAWPEARHTADYWQTLARQYDAVAHRLIDGTRRAAARVYLTAVTEAPATMRHLPWPRVLATTLAGRRGREAAGAWKRRFGVPG